MCDKKTSAIRRKAQQPARRRVVAKLWTTAERQEAEIEQRLSAGGDAATLERDAKTFAIIAKTVRELVALDAEANFKEISRPHGSRESLAETQKVHPEDNFSSRDIEQFREELAKRLDALRAERNSDEPA